MKSLSEFYFSVSRKASSTWKKWTKKWKNKDRAGKRWQSASSDTSTANQAGQTTKKERVDVGQVKYTRIAVQVKIAVRGTSTRLEELRVLWERKTNELKRTQYSAWNPYELKSRKTYKISNVPHFAGTDCSIGRRSSLSREVFRSEKLDVLTRLFTVMLVPWQSFCALSRFAQTAFSHGNGLRHQTLRYYRLKSLQYLERSFAVLTIL